MFRELAASIALLTAFAAGGCMPRAEQAPNAQAEGQAALMTPAQFGERYAAILADTADRSTPDRALETRWRIQDQLLVVSREAAQATQAANVEWETAGKRALAAHAAVELTGDALADATRRADGDSDFEERIYSREIQEVKIETPTRAVALVRIRNTSPVPQNVSLDAYATRERERGTLYRYTLSNVEGAWLVANIDEYDDVLREWRDRTTAEEPAFTYMYTYTSP